MRTRQLAIIGSCAASLVLVSAPAFAGQNSAWSTAQGVQGRFLHDGDSLRICDTAYDGESVYGQYKVNGGSTHTTGQWNGGNDTCNNFGTGNPAEGSTVTIRAGHQDELAPDDWGAWKAGIA